MTRSSISWSVRVSNKDASAWSQVKVLFEGYIIQFKKVQEGSRRSKKVQEGSKQFKNAQEGFRRFKKVQCFRAFRTV